MTVRVPRGGQRGLRLPRFLARIGNGMMLRNLRRGDARTQGDIEALMLETVGAKSGQARQSVLGFLPDGEDAWLVIASLAGTARNPAWLHNLAAQPEATIQFDAGRRVQVRAETLEGTDLAAAWGRLEREAPEYPNYKTKTDRSQSFASAVADGIRAVADHPVQRRSQASRNQADHRCRGLGRARSRALPPSHWPTRRSGHVIKCCPVPLRSSSTSGSGCG